MLTLLLACVDYAVTRNEVDDTFLQPARERGVDILWVVDASASMYEEQAALETHAAGFTEVLGRSVVDFRVGVATTTPGAPGSLVGEVLGSDTPGLAEAFTDVVRAAASDPGDRTERGFDAALAALDPTGQGGFSNTTADAEVVFFTDEDDSSSVDAEAFVTRLRALRGDATVRVNAIAGDLPDGCFSLAAAADAGARYIEAVEATGGARESNCAQDLQGALGRVALSALGLEDTFVLSDVPVPDSLEVRVSGAIIPSRPYDGWTYDAGLNAIRFDGLAVPPPGAGIEVSYFDWVGGVDTGSLASE